MGGEEEDPQRGGIKQSPATLGSRRVSDSTIEHQEDTGIRVNKSQKL